MSNKGKAPNAAQGRVRPGSCGSNSKDEMVTWLQYPLEDTLERGYCSELFGKFSSSLGKTKAVGDNGLPSSRENCASPIARSEKNENELAMGAGRASGFVLSEGAEAFHKVKTRMQQASRPDQFGTSAGHGSSHLCFPHENGEPLKLHTSIHPQECLQTTPFPENDHTYHGARPLHKMWLPALSASANQELQKIQLRNHAAGLSMSCGSSDVLSSNTIYRAGANPWAQGMNYGPVSEDHANLHHASVGYREPAWTDPHDVGFTREGSPLEEGQGTAINGDLLAETVDAAPSCSGGSGSSAGLSVKETSSVGKQKVEDYDCQSKNAEVDSAAELCQLHKRLPKRSRAAESHNLSEKRRRNKINERLRILQELIPNSTKTDKASVLDEAIEYLQALQSQLQMMSSRSSTRVLPMRVPSGIQHLQMAQMAPVHVVGIGLPYMHAHVGMGMGGVMDFSNGLDGRTFQALPAMSSHCYPMSAAISPQACGMEVPSPHLWAMQQQASAQVMQQQASAQAYQPVYVVPQAVSSVEMHQQDEQLILSGDSKDR